MRRRAWPPLLLSAALAAAGAAPAVAHEPLWGETPTIFGPHVFHPEVRMGFLELEGDPSGGGERTRAMGASFGLQYGVNRWVNVRATIPFVRRQTLAADVDGTVETTSSGIGDVVLSAKVRFFLRQDRGFQMSQSILFGWKLPTGADDREGPGGERLPPDRQPGSGQHGFELGWAFDRETPRDTVWTSLSWERDLGSGFRLGDRGELDAAYGRWLIRPNVADDLGLNLAFGLHGESAGNDHLADGTTAGNAHRFLGLHVTPILTSGRAQYRIGVLVPVARGGSREETDFDYEIRAAWEMFF